MKNKSTAIALTFLSILLFISIANAGTLVLNEGDKVEEFSLVNGLTKKKMSFHHDIMGKSKVTAIIFANTSCGACRKEISTLSSLSSQRPDFTTYAILVDMQGGEMIEEFHKRFNFNVTYLLDPDFTLPPTYGFYFTPSLILVDKDGKIIFKKGGYDIKKDEKAISDKIDELFK